MINLIIDCHVNSCLRKNPLFIEHGSGVKDETTGCSYVKFHTSYTRLHTEIDHTIMFACCRKQISIFSSL